MYKPEPVVSGPPNFFHIQKINQRGLSRLFDGAIRRLRAVVIPLGDVRALAHRARQAAAAAPPPVAPRAAAVQVAPFEKAKA